MLCTKLYYYTVYFADNLTIIAKNKYTMQDLLNIAFEYSSTWRFNFNPAKCVIILDGVDDSLLCKFYLGTNEIKLVTSQNNISEQ